MEWQRCRSGAESIRAERQASTRRASLRHPHRQPLGLRHHVAQRKGAGRHRRGRFVRSQLQRAHLRRHGNIRRRVRERGDDIADGRDRQRDGQHPIGAQHRTSQGSRARSLGGCTSRTASPLYVIATFRQTRLRASPPFLPTRQGCTSRIRTSGPIDRIRWSCRVHPPVGVSIGIIQLRLSDLDVRDPVI